MDVRATILLALLCAGSASAQQVHKCIDGGRAIYQSAPCEKGEPVKSWDAAPDRPNPYRQARIDQARRELEQRNYAQSYQQPRNAGVQGAAITVHQDPNRCQAAKARRAAAYKAAGLHRTFELSRQMDDMVYSACK